jgi:hypothetical protein
MAIGARLEGAVHSHVRRRSKKVRQEKKSTTWCFSV